MNTPTFFNAARTLMAFLLAAMAIATIPAQADDKAQQ